jgi:flagellar motor switch protein FliN/FliY
MPPQENAAMTPQTFLSRNSSLTREQTDNLKLLMNVPMSVSIEIGSARRKVKDILDFNQGTVLELDKLADDPVDIIVNGHLIARGDVVVLDDNFAIKVAEIVDSDLLDSLGN